MKKASVIISYFILFCLGLISLNSYIHYAFHAWFLQDDFSFLERYHDVYNFNDILHPASDFGRLISRNIYWHIMQSLFGYHATSYFIVNLGFILINALLIFYLVKNIQGNIFLAFSGAIAYLISAPTFTNFAWLSNSQHIIGHTFIFFFFIFMLRKEIFENSYLKSAAIIIYFFGIYSNILTLFAFPAVIFYWFFKPKMGVRIFFQEKIFFSLLTFITLFYLFFSKKFTTDHVYDLGFSWIIFASNFKFYIHHYGLLVIPVLAWGFYQGIKKEDAVLVFFAIGTVLFYIPFNLLKYQYALNYIAISQLFFLLTFFKLVEKYPWLISLILLIKFFMVDSWLYHYYQHNRNGQKTKDFIEKIKTLNLKGVETLCFKNGSTEFWWQVEQGSAFRIFVNPDIKYILLQFPQRHQKCDKIYVITH